MRPLLLLLSLAGCAHRPSALWLGGDLHLDRRGRAVLAPLDGKLAGAGIVNLEGAVAERALPGDGVRLINAPSALPELARAKIAVATIANNHAGDGGEGGDGGRAALARVGVACAGGVCGAAAISVGGRRVVVSAQDLSNGVPRDLAERLRRDRAGGDLLIATFHVSGPASFLPRPELKQAVAIAVGEGARIVAAHGTHAIGPVERRGSAVIAWGLGNLAFNCRCTDESDAIVLQIHFEKDQLNACAVPIAAGLNGESATVAGHREGIFDLLRAIGSRIDRNGCF